MPNREDLEKEIELTANLASLVTAYEEISVMRIQHIRRQVLATRAFREGLTGVYTHVRASQYQELLRLARKKERAKTDVTVLLSANQPLTGQLPHAVFEQFLTIIDRHPSDVVIVGRTGRESLRRMRPEHPLTYFDLSYEHLTAGELRPLLSHILQYQNITIVYGQYTSLVTQTPASIRIASVPEMSPQATPQEQQKLFFLFEPSLQQVVTFFEQQISAMVVRQTANEALLAQLGSRITAMENTSQRLEAHFKQLAFQQQKERRLQRNRKQRQLLSGVYLWKTW